MNATKPVLCAILLATAATLVGCDAGGGTDDNPPSAAPSTTARPADARITLGVTDGQHNASVRRAAGVSVTHGRLTHVTLTAAGGAAVAGTLAADASTWRPDADLDPGTAYRLTAEATNGSRTVRKTASFTTLAAGDRLIGTYVPDGGSTVGVGMPVSFTFDKTVTDRAAVAAGIHVTASSGQQVVGHWFGHRRLDFRPEHYWRPGSTVTVRIDLDGVKGGPGAYGVQDRTVRFTIGRGQVSTVDARTHTMKVARDGTVIRTIPVTTGAPGLSTYNGQMVIERKLRSTRMNGATVGFAGQYDIPDVPHAMQLSYSGTYIHGNYWAADSVFGHANVSHGCVGLNDVKGGGDPDQDAAWFYRNSLIGDVVIVEHSPDRTIAPDNGLNGWNMPWSQWTAGPS